MNTDIKTIKFRTRVGNKYMILTRPLTGEFVQYGANTGDLAYKVIVSCAELGIQRKGSKKLLIRPKAYGLSVANGVYDKDVVEFYDKDNEYDIGVIGKNNEGKWIVKTTKRELPLGSMRYFHRISTELIGKSAEEIIAEFLERLEEKLLEKRIGL